MAFLILGGVLMAPFVTMYADGVEDLPAVLLKAILLVAASALAGLIGGTLIARFLQRRGRV